MKNTLIDILGGVAIALILATALASGLDTQFALNDQFNEQAAIQTLIDEYYDDHHDHDDHDHDECFTDACVGCIDDCLATN